ncbi:hypothetical protein [Paenibacillus polymyxa]
MVQSLSNGGDGVRLILSERGEALPCGMRRKQKEARISKEDAGCLDIN